MLAMIACDGLRLPIHLDPRRSEASQRHYSMNSVAGVSSNCFTRWI